MKNEAYADSLLYKIRHSAAHVLAMAVLEWDPKAKLAIGPPIENGFYYDFELTKPLGEDELPNLEKAMQKIIGRDLAIEQHQLSRAEALTRAASQPFKKELIDNLPDEKLSHYVIGDFWDLCRGPHVKRTGEIKAYKLLSVAGAYWRGDEKQAMLTRVYGTAFEAKKELDEYLSQLEEAKKRDHRKLGQALDLFTFSDLVGGGLPLWTPKGTAIRQVLDDFVWRLRQRYGYERVEIPHITKKDLYEVSGHWDKFKDELFKIETRDGRLYALKPMNCPHHTQIFARRKWSYRELPQRYANTTMVYRDEQSGELSGLSRVLSISQDDAHVFCRADQVVEEMGRVWDIIDEFYRAFGFELDIRLSLRDPKTPDKYLGAPEIWSAAEKELEALTKKKGVKAKIGLGEATFYGPKIDFIGFDSLGREWQVATIQLDMNMPKNFGLTYVGPDGKDEPVVMIHAAIMGSLERFMAVIIEHFAGAFPFWLAPVQLAVLPISDKVLDYAREVHNTLLAAGYRSQLDDSNETLGKKIRNAELQKLPYALIIGEKEAQEKTVTIRVRHTADQSSLPLIKFVDALAKENKPN